MVFVHLCIVIIYLLALFIGWLFEIVRQMQFLNTRYVLTSCHDDFDYCQTIASFYVALTCCREYMHILDPMDFVKKIGSTMSKKHQVRLEDNNLELPEI